MRKGVTICRAGLLWAASWALGGCGDSAPPFDELPLRDALRADPAVIAALPDDARSRLAVRLRAAGASDDPADVVERLASPPATGAALDAAREQRRADALVVGVVTAEGVARVFKEEGRDDVAAAPRLPTVEGVASGTTAPLESRALDGPAGVTLGALMARTSTRRLVRVTGWPVGAIALGDAVYVDAAWLVALAPVVGGSDAGGPTGSISPLRRVALATSGDGTLRSHAGRDAQDGGAATGPAPLTMADASASDASWADASVPTFAVDSGPPPPPPTSSDPTVSDACGAGADTCASSSDGCDSQGDQAGSCAGSDDGCDGEDDQTDSCAGGDGSGDGCTPPPDDGSNCRVIPGRQRRRATLPWVLGPLAFLLKRRP